MIVKRKLDLPATYTKKLRSKLPRRRRSQISPIHTESSNSLVINDKPPQFSAVEADSSSSSCFPGWIPVDSKPRSTRQKRSFEVTFPPKVISGAVSRPITRSYLKQIEVNKKGNEVIGTELSESSCVESAIGATHILKQQQQQQIDSVSEVHDQIQSSFNEASTIYLLDSHSVPKQHEPSLSLEYSVDQQPKQLDVHDVDEYSLACSENLSFEHDSEHTNSLYELESDFFLKSSSLEFSDLSPSMLDSLDELSQESVSEEDDSSPPIYFPYFLEYQKQFSELDSSEASAQPHYEFHDQFTLTRFENEEYEESYVKFRTRERKLVLHDFGGEYSDTTEVGDLVLQQRLLMVNWIVKQSEVQGLQSETLFLGVSLLDRFLSRGFFTQKKKLQILGIACLTLATRIEENQPYNCVRKTAFYVGKNMYSRSEVIGMEWLVQEVLNFQCFLPTVYNFLWFYLKAAKANAEVEKRTKYLAVLSLLDHERLWYWPSTVAAGLVILASLAANQDFSCQWVMETHVRTKDDDLPECIQSLEWLVKYVC